MVVLHVVIVGLGLCHHFNVIRFGRVRVQLLQLCLGQVVHDARTVGVTHHVHRSSESISKWRVMRAVFKTILLYLWFSLGCRIFLG